MIGFELGLGIAFGLVAGLTACILVVTALKTAIRLRLLSRAIRMLSLAACMISDNAHGIARSIAFLLLLSVCGSLYTYSKYSDCIKEEQMFAARMNMALEIAKTTLTECRKSSALANHWNRQRAELFATQEQRETAERDRHRRELEETKADNPCFKEIKATRGKRYSQPDPEYCTPDWWKTLTGPRFQ